MGKQWLLGHVPGGPFHLVLPSVRLQVLHVSALQHLSDQHAAALKVTAEASKESLEITGNIESDDKNADENTDMKLEFN